MNPNGLRRLSAVLLPAASSATIAAPRAASFQRPPAGVRPFASQAAKPGDTSFEEPVRWHADASPPGAGSVAYGKLARAPGFDLIARADEGRRASHYEHEVSSEELDAAWQAYDAQEGGGVENMAYDMRMSAYWAIKKAEKLVDPLVGPSAELRADRNELFDRLSRKLRGDEYQTLRAFDQTTKALVLHAPQPPMEEMALKNGGRVWLRPLEAADPAGLARFLESLDDDSFGLRFPGAMGDSRAQLATQLVHEARASRRCFVLQDAKGTILGLADYLPKGGYNKSCEVNFVLADSVQGQGLGTQLLKQTMAKAREEGYVWMLATVADSNTPMLKVLQKLGVTAGEPSPMAPGHRAYDIDLLPPEKRQAIRSEHEKWRHREFIQEVQRWLKIRSWTGELDDTTRQAIKTFQSENGIEPTGKLTLATLRALTSDLVYDKYAEE